MASAEIHLPQSAGPEVYTWSFPGAPVRIHLFLHTVETLLGLLTEDVRRGLLIGRAWSPFSIDITGVQTLPEVGWNQLERSEIDASLARYGQQVMGFFRIHAGEELSLDPVDVARMEAHFSQPTDVCLLIKPEEGGSPTAGFFFWDNGRLESRFSFHDFPFDPEQLRLEAQEQQLLTGRVTEAEEIPRLVPARRRFRVTQVAILWMVAVAFCAVLGAGYAIRRYAAAAPPVAIAPVPVPVPAAAPSSSTLGLRVETQGSDLRLTWDPTSPSLQSPGVSAILTILDGETRREVPLEMEELRSVGSILYSPATRKVHFRMQLAGATPVAESVLALQGGPLPSTRKADPQPTPNSPAAIALDALPVIPVTEHKTGNAKPFVPPPAKALAQETWTQVALDSSPAVPAQTGIPASPVNSQALAALRTMPPPPVIQEAPRPTPAPIPSPTLVEGPKFTYLEPVAIRKVPPIVSLPVRRTLENGGQVRVKVQIDVFGRVHHIDLLSSTSPFLVGAAISAARLWRFEPARSNGRPVDSESTLLFTIPPYRDGTSTPAR